MKSYRHSLDLSGSRCESYAYVYMLINIAFLLKCQEHGLIYMSINLMSATVTVLLGEADTHQSTRMGVGYNINTLSQWLQRKQGCPELEISQRECVHVGICICWRWVPLTHVCIWKLIWCFRCCRHCGWEGHVCFPLDALCAMLVSVLATVREDEALGLLRMVQGCSHSVPILIDRAHFIKLPANFLQGTQGP